MLRNFLQDELLKTFTPLYPITFLLKSQHWLLYYTGIIQNNTSVCVKHFTLIDEYTNSVS